MSIQKKNFILRIIISKTIVFCDVERETEIRVIINISPNLEYALKQDKVYAFL